MLLDTSLIISGDLTNGGRIGLTGDLLALLRDSGRGVVDPCMIVFGDLGTKCLSKNPPGDVGVFVMEARGEIGTLNRLASSGRCSSKSSYSSSSSCIDFLLLWDDARRSEEGLGGHVRTFDTGVCPFDIDLGREVLIMCLSGEGGRVRPVRLASLIESDGVDEFIRPRLGREVACIGCLPTRMSPFISPLGSKLSRLLRISDTTLGPVRSRGDIVVGSLFFHGISSLVSSRPISSKCIDSENASSLLVIEEERSNDEFDAVSGEGDR